MKPTTLLCACLALWPLSSEAQDQKGGGTLVDLQSSRKEKEEKKATVTPPKPASQILGKRVVYGGFLTDFNRAEKKRPFLSLRTPLDPAKDMENLWFYPGTDKIQGVVLFSVKF